MKITMNGSFLWISSLLCVGCLAWVDGLSEGIVKPDKSDAPRGHAADTLDAFSSADDFIANYGYPAETHTVTTEDGYLLKVFRIPGSPNTSRAGVGTPVLLQHGFPSNCDDWVLTGPGYGLGFQLADQGYDVWLNNARGNHYSRNHTTLSTRDPRFWNFTWHEMGVYDLPAVIDYILAATNHTQLFYIGHSMGTTMFFVMASTRPEYNQKIRLMVALAPAAYSTRGVRSKLVTLGLMFSPELYEIIKSVGIYEIPRPNQSLFKLLSFLSKDGQPTQVIFLQLISDFFGNNPAQLNTTLLPVAIIRLIDSTSMQTLFHYTQTFRSGRFQMYDPTNQPGKKMPEYDLSKVTCPVNLVYALNDNLIHPQDVFMLRKSLPGDVFLTQVADPRFTHANFVFSNNVKTEVNDGIIKILGKYNT